MSWPPTFSNTVGETGPDPKNGVPLRILDNKIIDNSIRRYRTAMMMQEHCSLLGNFLSFTVGFYSIAGNGYLMLLECNHCFKSAVLNMG